MLLDMGYLVRILLWVSVMEFGYGYGYGCVHCFEFEFLVKVVKWVLVKEFGYGYGCVHCFEFLVKVVK